MPALKVYLLRLFLVSYSPLAAIAAMRHSAVIWPPEANPGFWILTGVAAVGFVDAYRLPRSSLKRGHVRVQLSSVGDHGGQVAAYIATYLLPFVGFGVDGWRDIVALAMYFAVLLTVFLRSDLALVNPTLYLTGWRVASATLNGKSNVLILVPKDQSLMAGSVYVKQFGGFLIYDREAAQ